MVILSCVLSVASAGYLSWLTTAVYVWLQIQIAANTYRAWSVFVVLADNKHKSVHQEGSGCPGNEFVNPHGSQDQLKVIAVDLQGDRMKQDITAAGREGCTVAGQQPV